MQYIPENGVYVYFRYDNQKTVMCILNSNNSEATIQLSRFSERMKNFNAAMDVSTGTSFPLQSNLTIGPKYLLVLELK